MIIGIDGNEANTERRVGVNQYAYELLWQFRKLQTKGECKHSFIIYLKNKPIDLPKEGKNWTYKVIPGGGMWVLRKLFPRLLLGRDKLELFFTPSHYLPPFSRVPMVCAIMDLGYLKFSGQFKRYDFWQLKLWSAWSLYISNTILTISSASAADIRKFYPFASGKTKITMLSGDTSLVDANITQNSIKMVKNKYGIAGDYVLFLGTLKPSKNVEGLVAAWADVKNKGNTKLVIAGKKGWMFESVYETVRELKISKSVVFTDFVADEDKPALVKGAKVFVLPSFWEGFGIDVLNAYSCGVPVVVSDRGSLPEVAGKPGIYVNPEKPVDIKNGIEKVLLMGKKEYNKLSEECRREARKYSWEKTARKTLNYFEKI